MRKFNQEKKEEKKQYDIFDDRETINSLEAEMKPFKDTLYPFYELCQSKGWIRIIYRDVTIDFTVNPDTVAYFTDYCARDRARTKRIQYFLDKQKEADKQRLIPTT